jgi:hypothetical protein
LKYFPLIANTFSNGFFIEAILVFKTLSEEEVANISEVSVAVVINVKVLELPFKIRLVVLMVVVLIEPNDAATLLAVRVVAVDIVKVDAKVAAPVTAAFPVIVNPDPDIVDPDIVPVIAAFPVIVNPDPDTVPVPATTPTPVKAPPVDVIAPLVVIEPNDAPTLVAVRVVVPVIATVDEKVTAPVTDKVEVSEVEAAVTDTPPVPVAVTVIPEDPVVVIDASFAVIDATVPALTVNALVI